MIFERLVRIYAEPEETIPNICFLCAKLYKRQVIKARDTNRDTARALKNFS